MEHDVRDEVPFDPAGTDQEPFLHIVAPNLDRISRSSFTRGSVSRRRIVRAGLLLVAILAGIAVVAVVGGVFASFG
jgi:hypothetical protein